MLGGQEGMEVKMRARVQLTKEQMCHVGRAGYFCKRLSTTEQQWFYIYSKGTVLYQSFILAQATSLFAVACDSTGSRQGTQVMDNLKSAHLIFGTVDEQMIMPEHIPPSFLVRTM